MKIDLHTHSEASRDGGITPQEYAQLLQDEVLDCVAITDHDRIDFALGMKQALGAENIIVGEEISTTQGEIIGLFLHTRIAPGKSAQETVDAIHAQGGLVCIPHPFETVRKGLSPELVTALRDDIDMIEGYNGRAFFQNFSAEALDWAKRNQTAVVASSDAHGLAGIGRTYTVIDELPTAQNLLALLKTAQLAYRKPPLWTLALPKFHRFKNLLRGQA